MNARRVVAAVAGFLVAAAAGAQSPSLHGAWMREMLDLDVRTAARLYRDLAADPAAPLTERVVADARLAELVRIGARVDGPVSPRTLPDLLGPGATADIGDPVVVNAQLEAELAVAGKEPAAAHHELHAIVLPPLRPLVQATAQAAAEQRDPAFAEWRSQRNRSTPGTTDATRLLDRIRANEIVRAELAGRPADAAALRARTFPSWKPQPWPGEPNAALARVRDNLDEWLRERQLSGSERETLRQLAQALDAAAKEGPARALALLDRMPVYAERLRFGAPEPR